MRCVLHAVGERQEFRLVVQDRPKQLVDRHTGESSRLTTDEEHAFLGATLGTALIPYYATLFVLACFVTNANAKPLGIAGQWARTISASQHQTLGAEVPVL